jgi:hypothetical protein
VESGVKCTSLHAQCFIRGGKFRKNSKVFLLLFLMKVSTQNVWLSGFEH